MLTGAGGNQQNGRQPGYDWFASRLRPCPRKRPHREMGAKLSHRIIRQIVQKAVQDGAGRQRLVGIFRIGPADGGHRLLAVGCFFCPAAVEGGVEVGAAGTPVAAQLHLAYPAEIGPSRPAGQPQSACPTPHVCYALLKGQPGRFARPGRAARSQRFEHRHDLHRTAPAGFDGAVGADEQHPGGVTAVCQQRHVPPPPSCWRSQIPVKTRAVTSRKVVQ